MQKSSIRIFAGSSGGAFTRRVCEWLQTQPGNAEVITFSEGNLFVRVLETVRDKDVYLIQPIGLKPNDEFTEILFWMDAFKRASAGSVTAIIPYFGYAKGDKKDEPRVSIRGRVCAECIELAGADRVVTMDLHSPQVQGFFKIPVDHLYAAPILASYVKKHMDTSRLAVVAPDAGFAKEARAFAGRLGVPTVICDKTRNGHDERARIIDIIGDVKGKDCLIVDDFSISGGTLIEVAEGLKDRGAQHITACISHILLNNKGLVRLEVSPIEQLISTDSVPNDCVKNCDKVTIVSVAPLFAETVRRIHMRESVSPLFDEVPLEVLQGLNLPE